LLIFVGFNLTFFTQFVMGSHGMPRRYYNYLEKFEPYHVASTIGSYVLSVGFVVMLGYLIHSLFRGERASANPWGAATLEWETASPPIASNFEHEMRAGDPYALRELEWDDEADGYVRRDPSSVIASEGGAH
jgi:cytochrome c oxidase subunit 1